MMKTLRQSLVLFIVGYSLTIQISREDNSVSSITAMGWEFVPYDISYPSVSMFTTTKLLYCNAECNKRIDCRTFDYDADSRKCRLWDVDQTTGSIVPSPMKPRSSVGTIRITPSIYANSHNRSCDKCVQSRYQVCDASSNTCQCPSKTYWNGSICLVQLLSNQICSQVNTCRSDLNFTCQPRCDLTYRCSTPVPIGVGQTVAGFCTNSTVSNTSGLQGPWGIYVSPYDGTLYVADSVLKSFQSFSPYSRVGQTILSDGILYPEDIVLDAAGTIYMTDNLVGNGAVYVQRPGKNLTSFPVQGQSTNSCLLTGIFSAYGIAVDQSGNIYISAFYCYMVVKWTLNATIGLLIAGQPTIIGSNSTTLNYPRFLHLDEPRGFLYVSDKENNRIQQFIIGGNRTGVTVAGGNGQGAGLNQLNVPGGVWVARDGQTLYIADAGNNRVIKWTIGASQGSVFAGSAIGTAGNTNLLLNKPGDIALDPIETYLYVSDSNNQRVQRFRLQ